jgi:hypothetical protein
MPPADRLNGGPIWPQAFRLPVQQRVGRYIMAVLGGDFLAVTIAVRSTRRCARPRTRGVWAQMGLTAPYLAVTPCCRFAVHRTRRDISGLMGGHYVESRPSDYVHGPDPRCFGSDGLNGPLPGRSALLVRSAPDITGLTGGDFVAVTIAVRSMCLRATSGPRRVLSSSSQGRPTPPGPNLATRRECSVLNLCCTSVMRARGFRPLPSL